MKQPEAKVVGASYVLGTKREALSWLYFISFNLPPEACDGNCPVHFICEGTVPGRLICSYKPCMAEAGFKYMHFEARAFLDIPHQVVLPTVTWESPCLGFPHVLCGTGQVTSPLGVCFLCPQHK